MRSTGRSLCGRLARCATPEPPLLLGLLRIAVAGVVLLSPEPATAFMVSHRAPVLRIAPEGLAWMGSLVPVTPHAVRFATALLRGSAWLSLLGVLTRPSLALLLASFIYVFGAAQLTGTVLHDMHLAWFLALLLVAPSGEALSCDAWARGRPLLGGPPSPAATAAVWFVRLLLGLVYLFPGVRKLIVGGAAWIASDNLRNQMRFKWFEAGGVVPWPRIDLAPWWCAIGAVAVIAFECGFIVLVLVRRARPFGVAAGLVFHGTMAHFLYVPFPSLWTTYVILIDGRRLRAFLAAHLPRLDRPASEPDSDRRSALPAIAMGAALAGAVAVQGLRGVTQAWPFACYPTFETLAPDSIADLAVDVHPRDAGASMLTLREPARRPQSAWGTTWWLLGLYGHGVDPGRLEAYAVDLAARDGAAATLANAARVTFVAEAYAIDPARYGEGPLTRTVVYEDERLEAR